MIGTLFVEPYERFGSVIGEKRLTDGSEAGEDSEGGEFARIEGPSGCCRALDGDKERRPLLKDDVPREKRFEKLLRRRWFDPDVLEAVEEDQRLRFGTPSLTSSDPRPACSEGRLEEAELICLCKR